MGLSRARNTVDSYRTGYTNRHIRANAVATHTCSSITGGVRRHLGSTKLHHRHQHPMKTFHLQPLRSTGPHHSKLHRPQKLQPFHLWQSVGDRAHFISRILYRSVVDPIRCIPRLLFRPQRLHSFGGVQVSCVPCDHFEGFETNNQILRK